MITRQGWRRVGDLLAWIAAEYPSFPAAGFEAAYRLLANPDITDEAARAVEELLAPGQCAVCAATLAETAPDGRSPTGPWRGRYSHRRRPR